MRHMNEQEEKAFGKAYDELMEKSPKLEFIGEIKLKRRTFISAIIPLCSEEKFKTFLEAQDSPEVGMEELENASGYSENYPEGHEERFVIDFEEEDDAVVTGLDFNGYKYIVKLFKIELWGTSERILFLKSLENLDLEKY